jgi:WD40 repeat protein
MLLLKTQQSSSTVDAVAFAPDGATLASTNGSRNLHLWDLRSGAGRVIAQGQPWPSRVSQVAFAPQGNTLAYGHGDVVLLDLTTGESRVLRSGAFQVSRIRFAPGGRLIAAGLGWGWPGQPTNPMLWDTVSGQPLAPWRPVRVTDGLGFSPDGRTLAAGQRYVRSGSAWEHLIRLCDPLTGEERIVLRGHGDAARDLAFSPDGERLAAACGQFLWVWDVGTGRPLWHEKVDRLHFQSVAFTPDGNSLAAVRNDHTVRFWDANTWRLQAVYDWDIGPLVSLAIAADGMRAAAGSKRGRIVVWDIDR